MVKEKARGGIIIKCPNCNNPRAKYLNKREKELRLDYAAKCTICRFKFDTREYYDVVDQLIIKEEKRITPIKMKYIEGGEKEWVNNIIPKQE